MQAAINLARQAQRGNSGAPIGCVIVFDGNIIGSAHNEVSGLCDATAHAEIVAIRRACSRIKQPRLQGATLYSTLQPCGMCSMAAIWSNISRIVYGAGCAQVHKMYFEDRHLDTMDFIRDAYRDDLALDGGILADQCADLYYSPDANVPISEQSNR
jgi:tRNA(adenine34) deaminase